MMGLAIVSPDDLKQGGSADGAAPSIVDARPPQDYERGHIPGAVHLDWTAWCAPAPNQLGRTLSQPGYWGVLADHPPDRYAARLEALGLSNHRPIVIYADGPRSHGREGRIAWMVLYLGAHNVALLDGGWHGWIEAGGVVETTTTEPPPGQFAVKLQAHRRCRLPDLVGVLGSGPGHTIVDTRSRTEFEGGAQRYQPRMGHLPSARLVPFADLFHPSGRYVDRWLYRKRMARPVHRGSSLIAYCEVGVRASLFAVLHELYTGEVVRVYDGSIMEWALEPALPVCKAGSSGGTAHHQRAGTEAPAAAGAAMAATGTDAPSPAMLPTASWSKSGAGARTSANTRKER